jgi:parvulin-like peptidyl-prolyl isomerase
MHKVSPFVFFVIVAIIASACQSRPEQDPADHSRAKAAPANLAERPVAYLDAKPVTQDEVYRLLAGAHGGEALAEILLDRAVRDRLKQETLELTATEIDAEKTSLLKSLSPNPDEAAQLLQEMRAQRGLDAKRFDAMLRRNAGLRLLVRDEVQINAAAVNQAYQLRYGPRYRVRLIVSNKLDVLTKVRSDVLKGSSFTDEAIEHSTDASASQGGLLSPISPADPTYPKAIRDALSKLKMNAPASRLSPAIALDSGYALLWLEAIQTPDDPPSIEAVRSDMETIIRADLERVRMRQLARTLIEQADVVVLDPAIDKAWKRQLESIGNP